MKTLNNKNYKNLIIGSSIFSTGGGIELSLQIEIFESIFKRTNNINYFDIEELDENMYIANVYGVGSCDSKDVFLDKQLKVGFEYIKNNFGYNIEGIFEAETNIEGVVFDIGEKLGIKIIDCDCTGGRAVPELKYDNFVIFGKKFTPIVAIDKNNKITTILEYENIEIVEKKLRQLSIDTNGSIGVIDHIIKVKHAKKLLSLGILNRNYKIGEFMSQLDMIDIKKILKKLNGIIISHGIIQNINLKNDGGFLKGSYEIKSVNGDISKIYVQNENMYCQKNSKLISKFPELIIGIDPINKIGFHNSKLINNSEIYLIKIGPSKIRKNYKYNMSLKD